MCNPTAILGAQALSGGIGAAAAYGSAASRRSQLRYEADVADLNAKNSEQQAAVAMERGRFQVNQVRRQSAQFTGSARQTYARSGVDLNSGTPSEVVAGIQTLSEEDARQAEINAIREAWGYRTAAENQRSEARASRAGAKAISPGMAAATTLIGSAASWAGSAHGFQKAGAFGRASAPSPAPKPPASGAMRWGSVARGGGSY